MKITMETLLRKQIAELKAELDQAKTERDEFQKRLTYIQQGHNPYEEIDALRKALEKIKTLSVEMLGEYGIDSYPSSVILEIADKALKGGK